MLRCVSLFLTSIFVLGFTSIAYGDENSPVSYSRGFQQAKILARAANDSGIPSRGFWMGSRLVKGLKNISINKSQPKASQLN